MKFFFLLLLSLITLSGFCQEEDERVLAEIERERAKQVEKALEVERAKDQVVNQTTQVAEKLKEAGAKGLESVDLMDDKARAAIKKLLQENGFSNLDRDLVKELIMAKARGKPLGHVFERIPTLLEIIVDVMRSKEALPGLIDILDRKEDLKLYFYYCLGFFVLGFLIRRYLFKKEWGLFRRLSMRLALTLCLSILSIMTFYSMFEIEMKPTWMIIKNHF